MAAPLDRTVNHLRPGPEYDEPEPVPFDWTHLRPGGPAFETVMRLAALAAQEAAEERHKREGLARRRVKALERQADAQERQAVALERQAAPPADSPPIVAPAPIDSAPGPIVVSEIDRARARKKLEEAGYVVNRRRRPR